MGAAHRSSRASTGLGPMVGSHTIKFGGENTKVGEHLSAVIFEFEAYPEPKILTRAEMRGLMRLYDSQEAVAEFLECSQSHPYFKSQMLMFKETLLSYALTVSNTPSKLYN